MKEEDKPRKMQPPSAVNEKDSQSTVRKVHLQVASEHFHNVYLHIHFRTHFIRSEQKIVPFLHQHISNKQEGVMSSPAIGGFYVKGSYAE